MVLIKILGCYGQGLMTAADAAESQSLAEQGVEFRSLCLYM